MAKIKAKPSAIRPARPDMSPVAPRGRSGPGPAVQLAGVCALAYVVALGLRLIELPEWSDPAFRHAGERLMATHDAYAFLAGAKEPPPRP